MKINKNPNQSFEIVDSSLFIEITDEESELCRGGLFSCDAINQTVSNTTNTTVPATVSGVGAVPSSPLSVTICQTIKGVNYAGENTLGPTLS